MLKGLLLIVCLSSACGGNDAPFEIAVGPTGAQAFQDAPRLLKVDLTRKDGFAGDVTVTLIDAPDGVFADSIIFSGEVATEALEIWIAPSVAAGDLELTVVASSGDQTSSTKLDVEVLAGEPRSQEKIEAARASGQIDLGTSLLYRSYARFGDDRLPEEFRGSGSDEDLMLPRAIEIATPTLSADAVAALRPFIVRPDHPESVYATESAKRGGDARRGGFLFAPAPQDCAGGNAWRSKRSATIPVRVWIECGDELSAATEAKSIDRMLALFDKLWTPMTGLMGDPLTDAGGPDEGGDDAIDVYLVLGAITRGDVTEDFARLANLGVAAHAVWSPPYPVNSFGHTTASGYIALPRLGAFGEQTRGTITHELLHILQFARNFDVLSNASGTLWWFVEASATWAMLHYDRTLSWPSRIAKQDHMGYFGRFQKETLALNDTAGPHTYSAYIWLLFLEQETGSRGIIGDIWIELESAASFDHGDNIIDDHHAFAAHFHEFALRNLNSAFVPGDPLPRDERYLQLDDLFPDEILQPKKEVATLTPGVYTKSLDMPPLSATYFVLSSGEENIQKVELDFTGLQPGDSLDIDALVLTPDGWLAHPLSFTGEGKVVFCFDAGQSTETLRGSFDGMELILSNHARAADARVSGDLVITSSAGPCGVWAGNITGQLDFSDTVSGTVLSQTYTADVVFEFDDETKPGGSEILFRIREGYYTYDMLITLTGICRTIETAQGPMVPGDITVMAEGVTSATLFLYTGGDPLFYGGGGASWEMVTQTTNCGDGNVDVTTMNLGFITWWSTMGVFEVSPDGMTMEGSVDVPQPMGMLHFEWNLSKMNL